MKELRRGGFARFDRLLFLGRVEIQDLSALSRARVDCAQVFAAFHLPNRSDHAVFLDGLVSYFFVLRHCALIFGQRRLAFSHINFFVAPTLD